MRRDAGFTLIETLAVLLLTGLLVSSMTLVSGQWMRSWNRGAANLQRVATLDVAMDRFAEDARSALALPPVDGAPAPVFIGDERSLRFVHPSIDRGAPPGLEVVAYAPDGDGVLTRLRAPYDASVRVGETALGDAAPLLRKPYGARFAYFGDDGEWVDEWRGPRPPAAVRATFSAPGLPAVATVAPVLAPLPAKCVAALGFAQCRAQADGRPADGAAASPGNAANPGFGGGGGDPGFSTGAGSGRSN
jgi:general secretion pathway protein J